MSEWIYHTDVRPIREEVNSEYKNEFENSFATFLGECKIEVPDELDNGVYSLEIDTHDDVINKKSNYHVSFLRSKFILNPRFKRELIEYYNPKGYFVNGPIQREKYTWVVELKKKINF